MPGRPKSRAKKEALEQKPSHEDKSTIQEDRPGHKVHTEIGELPSPRSALAKLDLAHRALSLRKVGYDYYQIAELMQLDSPRAAEILVNRMLKGALRGSTAEDIRRLDLARLDRYESILNDAMESNPKMVVRAVEVAMQVQKRRAELMGLDAPTKHEIDSTKTTVVEYVRDPTQDDHKKKVAEIIDADYENLPQLEERLRLPEHEDDQAPGSPDPGDPQ